MQQFSIRVSRALLIVLWLSLAFPAQAQPHPGDPLHIVADAGGVQLQWHLAPGEFPSSDIQRSFARVEIGGARLAARSAVRFFLAPMAVDLLCNQLGRGVR